mmetsp:Transcript_62289/g.129188  ORF Transcript_62289/g.129188 Transcript_62289/m.129188 type:complete len:127 (+) Transcript_62289:411-791(+)
MGFEDSADVGALDQLDRPRRAVANQLAAQGVMESPRGRRDAVERTEHLVHDVWFLLPSSRRADEDLRGLFRFMAAAIDIKIRPAVLRGTGAKESVLKQPRLHSPSISSPAASAQKGAKRGCFIALR